MNLSKRFGAYEYSQQDHPHQIGRHRPFDRETSDLDGMAVAVRTGPAGVGS